MTVPSTPITTPILDNFNRPDETPMTGWTDIDAGFHVLSNQAAGGASGGATYWNTPFGIDQEAYVTIAQFDGDNDVIILARLDPGAGNYYSVVADPSVGGDTITMAVGIGGVEVAIGSYDCNLQNGDSICIQCQTSTIRALYRPVGGDWIEAIVAVDSSVDASGYVSMVVFTADTILDDFGGGVPVSPPPPVPTEPTPTYSRCDPDPILRITDGTNIIDLLNKDSGWEMEDPNWNPQIAQYKSGGSYVNSGLAEGQRLVHKEYDNVIETIPLSAHGTNQDRTIQTLRRLLQLGKQASDYWTKSYEYDDVWIEVKPAGSDCLTGYARIVKMSIPELTNPFGQPFFSAFREAIMNGITLTIEREPLWRGLPPGEILGPMYNLIKNSDFELWNFGTADSQPDSWTDLETLQITGQNSRESTSPNSGQYALKIRVSGSTAAGKAKGVTQIIESTKNNTEYTVVAWVRSEGVSNGVGRILVTYSSQLEVYRVSTRHGWTLYTGKFTTGTNDVVAINLEILTTAANTDGTIYIDSLMLLEGDFETEAGNETLPYMTSSHIVNHWDQPGGAVVEAGDINFVDVWNVPGDEDALVRLEVQNNTTPADTSSVVEVYSKVIVGQRRTGDVFKFDNYHDPTGVNDATASSNNRVDVASLNTNWVTATGDIVGGGGNTRHNVGRYRALARVWDTRATVPTLAARLSYFMGAANVGRKVLNSVIAPIRGNWCMLDLTPNAALIWERKQSIDFPAQLGYILEVMRDVGTDTVRLDYVLLIPTDGGYVKADIEPALTQGNILVVDNTSSLEISGTYKRAGWSVIFSDPALTIFFDFADFNGAIYASGNDGIGSKLTRVYRQVGNNWNVVFTWNYGAGNVLETYNGKLYGTFNDAAPTVLGGAYLYRTSDGLGWTSVTQLAGYHISQAMRAFSGRLFIPATADGGAGPAGVFTWDDTSLVLSYSFPGAAGGESSTSSTVYGGNLYIGTNGPGVDAGLYQYNPTTSAWSQIATFTGMNSVASMVEFNGKLYLGFAGGHGIWAYDGSTTVQVFNPPVPTANYTFTSLVVYNNKLYAVSNNSGLTFGTLLVSEDGVTWEVAYDPTLTIQLSYGFTVINGLLYLGARRAGVGTVYALSDGDIAYAVSDFQGGAFMAPPRRFTDPRRHRWVFSYDRENFVNNADDKALIGLGYIPRYLALRGSD